MKAVRRIRIVALGRVAWLSLAACGARSSLAVDMGAGGASTGATANSSSSSAASSSSGAPSTYKLDDMSTWRTERYREQGDYDRAAVAVSGEPWVALKQHGGNIVLGNLGVDAALGIVFHDRIEIANSLVYPVAFDVDVKRFVLVTTSGINWNGAIELWRIDRATGAVLRVPVGTVPPDPNETVSAAVGLVGSDLVVAYSRLAENHGTIELRDDLLNVTKAVDVSQVSFTAARTSDAAVDVYAGANAKVHAEAGTLSKTAIDPSWQVIGGLDSFRVEMGQQIRLTDGASVWSTAWPHSQISPPAVVRIGGGQAAFALETELTAVVGHVQNGALAWMNIDSAPGAPGVGVGLMPVIEPGRLGLFYLGIEIPSPVQPLRYFGRACP